MGCWGRSPLPPPCCPCGGVHLLHRPLGLEPSPCGLSLLGRRSSPLWAAAVGVISLYIVLFVVGPPPWATGCRGSSPCGMAFLQWGPLSMDCWSGVLSHHIVLLVVGVLLHGPLGWWWRSSSPWATAPSGLSFQSWRSPFHWLQCLNQITLLREMYSMFVLSYRLISFLSKYFFSLLYVS